jgi:hypothetical protein
VLFAAIVPVFFGKKFGEILTYLIPGKTPFLFARPVAEELGLIIDHRQGLGKWHGDNEWFKLRQRPPIGHIMLDLLENFQTLRKRIHPEYTLLPERMLDHVDVKRYIDANTYCNTDYGQPNKDVYCENLHVMEGTAIRELGPKSILTFDAPQSTSTVTSTDH